MQVVCWGCGFADLWRFPEEEGAALGNQSAQSPAISGQPWACHGALQSQMQPLQSAAGVVEVELGAAVGLGRLVVGVVV